MSLPGIDGSHTLVIFHHVPQMVPSRIMRLAHAHRVVREVDIAVVAYNEPQQSVKIREVCRVTLKHLQKSAQKVSLTSSLINETLGNTYILAS